MEKSTEELHSRVKHLEELLTFKEKMIEVQKKLILLLEQNRKDVTKRYTPKPDNCVYKILIPKNR